MLVHVVQLIASPGVAAHAARDYEHGDAVEERLADAAGSMRHAGSRNDQQGAEPGAGPADGVGHEGAAALVGDQHGRDGLGGVQLVVDFGVVHAGDAEGVTHADLFQRVAHEPGGCFPHVYLQGFRLPRGPRPGPVMLAHPTAPP